MCVCMCVGLYLSVSRAQPGIRRCLSHTVTCNVASISIRTQHFDKKACIVSTFFNLLVSAIRLVLLLQISGSCEPDGVKAIHALQGTSRSGAEDGRNRSTVNRLMEHVN